MECKYRVGNHYVSKDMFMTHLRVSLSKTSPDSKYWIICHIVETFDNLGLI